MRPSVLRDPGDARVEDRPDPEIMQLLDEPAPTLRSLPDLTGRICDRSIDPGKDFDLELDLAEAAERHEAMDERRAIKALLLS